MYVIFDMDGVIVDSEAVYTAGYLHAAELYDLPIEDMRAAIGRATGVTDKMERAIMIGTFGHLPQFSMDKTYKACRDYFNNIVETGQMKLKPGAAEILRFLNDNKIPTGLASSSPRAMIEKVLKPHDVLQYFDTVVSGDMVERGKPDPEIFLKCAAQSSASLSQNTARPSSLRTPTTASGLPMRQECSRSWCRICSRRQKRCDGCRQQCCHR